MSGIFEDVARLRGVDGQPGGNEVPITVIEPEGHARGGIVVLHESRKFTDALLDLMRALATEGWIAVAPNLFHREDVGSDAKVFGDNLFADFDACHDWLTKRGVLGDCIGALGFDDAGAAAFLVATNRPIGAAVSVAARGITSSLADGAPPLVEAAPALQAPWLGLYGDDDPETPTEHVEALKDAVSRAAVATHVVVYSGLRHRADEPRTADEPDGDPIVDAQTRIFDWFDANLR
ncbi:carboxymethylenebutenolidase [Skermania sp. ID1734]|uniref:dienelactone hydrolase family protein n=1 Tax=Skermania sp. ID1734 TaxID=2597516 RepID=UPI00117FE506|nr:dienelactone hydrolase family protein [Skermania sp. ID1734]TSE00695.1 carboxymethylenebutenolidase [Skermania sp. ID1734]